MPMQNPPHPGECIRDVCLEPYSASLRSLAERLDVVPLTLTRLIRGQSAISPENWLAMQHNCYLWQARQRVDLRKVKKLDVDAALQGRESFMRKRAGYRPVSSPGE
jgi:antitoxin HigA-1